ncbi:hypothetical protein [Duganella sp. Root336D2]|uniref:hypothetical protein n=1 Tax=Duganella sp. Root336D2 TaxID=1736518 RepID=UPI000712D824|nr:hypothetical protein [Duganella sp. Root336D2]KQV51332.1 hypothetical protein ASD07_10585 [Duganella sp. Root336D2]
MKKQPKHVLKAAVAERRVAGAARSRDELLSDLNLDPASVALFAGIHASKEFTVEAAHRAFAGIKRKK